MLMLYITFINKLLHHYHYWLAKIIVVIYIYNDFITRGINLYTVMINSIRKQMKLI